MDLAIISDIPSFLLEGVPNGLVSTLGLAATGLVALGAPLLGVELVQIWRSGRLNADRVRGMATSLFCLVPFTATQALMAGTVGAGLAALWSVTPFPWPVTAGTAVLALLLADFAYYWDHRLSHRVGAAWAWYHSVHHSAHHYDQTVAARITFLEHFLNLPNMTFMAAQVLLGIHPVLVLLSTGLVLAWQQWIHTEAVGKLGWLDGWLNTPSNHRVHHGSNEVYLDANYGGILMIWDRLFGTYVPETEPVRYGLVHPIGGDGPFRVHFGVVPRWWAYVRGARSWPEALVRAFAPPDRWEVPAGRSAER